ncbi:hypothetical protein MTO96_016680 [Rhipicephalus appendiculatus]
MHRLMSRLLPYLAPSAVTLAAAHTLPFETQTPLRALTAREESVGYGGIQVGVAVTPATDSGVRGTKASDGLNGLETASDPARPGACSDRYGKEK